MVFRGRILDIIQMNGTACQVVVNSKKDDKFFPVCFIAFGSIADEIRQIGIEKRDTVKIEYYLKSKKHQDKYWTSAIIETIKITEKKPEQLEFDIETGEIL